MKEWNKFLMLVFIFVGCYSIPWDNPLIRQAGLEAFMMLREYAREHVLTCLVPAFFIAGAIAVFVAQASVLNYFGVSASKMLSYGVASLSGTILAVCSCTVLPLFAGIYTRGAGIGPATAFLYSGPALALLLAGPALSLPSMIVLMSIMGIRKTAAYCTIIVVLSTGAGIIFGGIAG